MLGSRQLVLLAALLCTGLANPARAEGYLTTGVAIGLKPGQLTLIAKPGIVGIVPLPRTIQVFVFQRISIGDAQEGATIATAGVVVKGAARPSLDAGETYLVHQPVPDVARRALALRFLPPHLITREHVNQAYTALDELLQHHAPASREVMEESQTTS